MSEDNTIYRIVLVDNDAVPRRIARGICELIAQEISQRAEIQEFDDGVPAWNYLSQLQEPPHLLLTDMNMNVMYGDELIEKVQAKFPRDRFPSLNITLASDTSAEMAKSMAGMAESNGYAFLRKPYEIPALKEHVKKCAPKPAA